MSTHTDHETTQQATTIDRRNWRVIVLDDDVHTVFEVMAHLRAVLPGMGMERAEALTWEIHRTGAASVWEGPREPGELYHHQLADAGLHLAPLEPVA